VASLRSVGESLDVRNRLLSMRDTLTMAVSGEERQLRTSLSCLPRSCAMMAGGELVSHPWDA